MSTRSDRPRGMTTQALVTKYIAHQVAAGHWRPQTGNDARSYLGQFATVAGDNLDRRSIRRWERSVGHLAPATRRGRVSLVRGFARWLVTTGRIPTDPTVELRSPKEPRRLPRAARNPNELAAGTYHDPRLHLIVLLMLQQGCRRVEVARLHLADIDVDGGSLRLVGKGGHERTLPLMGQVRVALARWLEVRGEHAGPLVTDLRDYHRGIAAPTIGRMVSAAMIEAGSKVRMGDGTGPHALRHRSAHDMIANHANVLDVQQVLGHAHLVTTQRYVPLLVDGLAAAMGGRVYGAALPEGGMSPASGGPARPPADR